MHSFEQGALSVSVASGKDHQTLFHREIGIHMVSEAVDAYSGEINSGDLFMPLLMCVYV